MNDKKISYVRSLRFKMMLLVVIPLLCVAVGYIALSHVFLNNVLRGAGITADTGWVTRTWGLVFLGSAAVLFPPMTIAIGRIIRPLRQLVQKADQLALGDVNITLVRDRGDEYGMLQDSFSQLVSSMRTQAEAIARIAEGDLTTRYEPRSDQDSVGKALVRLLSKNAAVMHEISNASGEVSAAAAQVATGSQAIARGNAEQTASLAVVSDTMGSISGQAALTLSSTNKAIDLSGKAHSLMTESMDGMERLIVAMSEISDASASISKVMKVIDDIAFQTNILALNAAVEAARAGQHGKGFAVVAEEVRTLSGKSAAAAKETAVIIEETIHKVETGASLLGTMNGSLRAAAANSESINAIIADIAGAMKGQAGAVAEMDQEIGQVTAVVQHNAATAQEAASASQELSSQADLLDSLVAQFKLSDQARLRGAGRHSAAGALGSFSRYTGGGDAD